MTHKAFFQKYNWHKDPYGYETNHRNGKRVYCRQKTDGITTTPSLFASNGQTTLLTLWFHQCKTRTINIPEQKPLF